MRRTRFDIYADIIEVVKRHSGGCGITRISYGAGMPNDRTKRFLRDMINLGLIQPSIADSKKYIVTKRGLEFLDAYYKLKSILYSSKK
ncbi:MAG: winged helix-turn-helix domain-containing protein [Candidatus Asgardarchaeia archaeon]